MMKFVLFLCVLISGYSHACDYKDFSSNQWANVEKAYLIGEPHNYGYTLASIIIKESTAGKYKVNPDSKDYGITQMNIKTLVARMGMKNNSWNRSVAASRVVEDDDLALALGLEELLYWDKVRKGNWRQVVGSYNAGWRWTNSGDYYKEIGIIIKKLKGCMNAQK